MFATGNVASTEAATAPEPGTWLTLLSGFGLLWSGPAETLLRSILAEPVIRPPEGPKVLTGGPQSNYPESDLHTTTGAGSSAVDGRTWPGGAGRSGIHPVLVAGIAQFRAGGHASIS